MTQANEKQLHVVSIGAGYVGGPTMVVMADKCREHKFTVVDVDPDRISSWDSGEPPFYEEGLEERLRERLDKNLFFSTQVEEVIAEADIVFISVNTPTKLTGEGAGMACDTSRVEAVARCIAENASRELIVVEKTTIPVGMAEKIKVILGGGEFDHTVVSNPEFLAEGTAIKNLLWPDRVVIGFPIGSYRGAAACETLANLYRHWVPEDKIVTMDTFSSELTKLTANAFLAQRVSSINSIAEICEATNADVTSVARGIGSDPRVGSQFLNASLGFGGSCFRKDVWNLTYIAESLGLEEVAEYWSFVNLMNERQQDRLASRLLKACFGSLQEKKVVVLGYAFKVGTGDIRDTPAARVCHHLLQEGADLLVTDPKALQTNPQRTEAGLMARNMEAKTAFTGYISFHRHEPGEHKYQLFEDADAVVIATGWPEYADLDWRKVYGQMRQPATIMDGRNLLRPEEMADIGFRYLSVGRPDW